MFIILGEMGNYFIFKDDKTYILLSRESSTCHEAYIVSYCHMDRPKSERNQIFLIEKFMLFLQLEMNKKIINASISLSA